uniref:Uncharacterized protein n=1 Tax=Candidatus Kentrum sp. LFY TaxID=2126342 RepID=A0A450WI47_9GAMM|nr:MAG: Protein of unknown function (DUF2586) [Candidatus Kentron sp. LFY]
MALGRVQVNDLDLGQGAFPEPERKFLFMGVGVKNQGKILYLNNESDLDAELGDCELEKQVEKAKLNAGQNWVAAVLPMAAATDWVDSFAYAMNENVQCEAVVITDPVTAKSQFTDMFAQAEGVRASRGRRVFFIAATRAFNPATDTWTDYIAEVNDLTDGVSAYRVSPVAEVYPGFLGSYAGRLCNRKVLVADTPMRVNTGTLMGISELPTDTGGVRFTKAHAEALNNARFTVPHTYDDYPGIYMSDGQTLDAPAGDFQVVENLRIVDKAARRIRILAIRRVGDRKLNSTPISIQSNKTYFMRPLREMSKSIDFLGERWPGDVKPPQDGDIEIQWTDRTHVKIFTLVRPYHIPKAIEVNIALDLSSGNVV